MREKTLHFQAFSTVSRYSVLQDDTTTSFNKVIWISREGITIICQAFVWARQQFIKHLLEYSLENYTPKQHITWEIKYIPRIHNSIKLSEVKQEVLIKREHPGDPQGLFTLCQEFYPYPMFGGVCLCVPGKHKANN